MKELPVHPYGPCISIEEFRSRQRRKRVSGTDDMDPSFHSQELTDLCATLQIRLEATLDLTAKHHRRLHTTDVYTLGQIRTESHKEHMTQRLQRDISSFT
ncbi:unnamed protein product [Pleuronectes platessa]|uniref:Uncharacterized protein n=1 Tax=Pleuronectes platessa TaxID=8262 RepID=A0A9N7ZDI5_PLEPL|nr:unnamed protein product [Pleuronectes platessa]